MEERRLDGNAVGGLLGEVFAADVTVAVSRCAACGASEPVGALWVYAGGPGAVVRCPHCSAVLLRVVRGPSQVWLDLRGVTHLELQLG
jgi:hypothetical protein